MSYDAAMRRLSSRIVTPGTRPSRRVVRERGGSRRTAVVGRRWKGAGWSAAGWVRVVTALRVVAMAVMAMVMAGAGVGCETRPEVSDQDVRVIEAAELSELLSEEPERTLLIDVRRSDAFDRGRLPGAVHMPLPELPPERGRLRGVDRTVVYGQGWSDQLAPAAGKKLLAAGIDKVRVFRGGVEAWLAEGHELVER